MISEGVSGGGGGGTESEWRRMPEAGERDVGEDDLAASDTTWHGQMVRVVGLKARPDLNGKALYHPRQHGDCTCMIPPNTVVIP